MDKFDVVVVGNGILGLTLSYFLKKEDPKISVALIGKQERVGCASLVAGAMLNLWAELTPGQFENRALAEKFNLAKQGVDEWEGFAAELSDLSGQQVDIHWGTYLLKTLNSTQIEDRSFAYIKQSLKRFNIKHKELVHDDLPWLKPSQGSRLIEALWVPDGHVDSRKVIQALDVAVKRMGVHTFNQNAVTLSAASSKLFGSTEHCLVLDDKTQITGKNIVLANGAYAQNLIDQNPSLRKSMPRLLFGIGAGVDITFPGWVHEYGGLGKEIFDLKEVVRTTDRGGACGVHLVPYGDGKFYAGASSLTSLDDDREPKLHGIHVLLHTLMDEIHRSFFNSGIGLRGNGFRPTSADCFPMIGETNKKGIWMHNGTKRDGFTMSPYISRNLASAILGKQTNLPPMFNPCRNLISYKTKEEAIRETELMYVGADYQHGGIQVPYMVDKYNEMRRNEIVSFYDKRSIHDFGIHPELIHLYENDKFYEKINHRRDSQDSKPNIVQELLALVKPQNTECTQ
jgi:glycine/D-amino acid oxidase-like deaminating enzyme